jgi:hypothetical protein
MKRKLLPMSGYQIGGGGSGGGSSQPSQSSVYQTNIPDYAKPYVETMLGTAQQQVYNYAPDAAGNMVPTSMKGYQPFSNDPSAYVAGASPMQQQAYQGAANMGVTPQTGQASGMAGMAGMMGLGTNYQAGQFGNQFQSPGAYQAGQFNPNQVQAPELQNYQMQGPQNVQAQNYNAPTMQGAQTDYNPNLQNFQMGPAQNVRTQSFANPYSAQAYMSPYMQSVVENQQREAQRTADIASTGRAGQATQAGAFGGSRQAIMDAEAARNLALQKGDIQSQGLQSAYSQAQNQFNTEQQARLQAQMANQQAGINVGGQNLNALLGVQQLGAGQNLQSQLANQQAGMTAQQLAEQSRQYGAGQGMTAAQLAAQYGLAGQQAGEQSQQFGASLGMQGLQTALGAAGQLGTLGQNQYGQQMGINQLQNQYGSQQQQQQQAIINQQIQNYATAQQYPMMQLGNMSNLLRGLPMQSTTVQGYQASPNPISQLGGLGLTAAGIAGKLGGAKGGQVKDGKKQPAGLAELALSRMQ